MYPFELLKWFKKIATLGGHSALENQGTLFKMQEEETLEALQPENKTLVAKRVAAVANPGGTLKKRSNLSFFIKFIIIRRGLNLLFFLTEFATAE